MKPRALFALVFVLSARAGVPADESVPKAVPPRAGIIALACSPVAGAAQARRCTFTASTVSGGAVWYRLLETDSRRMTINGVQPVPRPIDRLTATLGLNPYLIFGGPNVIEIEGTADVWMEIVPRVSIVAVRSERQNEAVCSNKTNLSVWVENTLENGANVAVRIGAESRFAYVPPESYDVVLFSDDLGGDIEVVSKKFPEALEGGYESRQRFLRDASGKWNLRKGQ
jgi:hypothetical protein